MLAAAASMIASTGLTPARDIRATMFKRLLLSTLLLYIAMWGAGYNVVATTRSVLATVEDKAGSLGPQAPAGADWGRR